MSGGAVCNIGGTGRRRRTLVGFAVLAAAVAAFVLLDGRFGTRWWRLGLVPLLGFAFLCWVQVREST